MLTASGTSRDIPACEAESVIVRVTPNLNVHKNATCVDAIRDAGADVLYLPLYSPEFNPIEKAWANMKDDMRKLDTMTREAFDMAVAAAMDTISVDDCKAWVTHAGYTIN
ncbi:MAG: hypothetical protein GY811_18675 [Myxococcales bacterium]|nr:hypothetical protein [Myxococcales bacterium]